jgi:hypothetical protein
LCCLLPVAVCCQVDDLQLEKQQLQASHQALQQQMAAFQQQLQQLQQEMHVGAALGRCSPVLRSLAGVDVSDITSGADGTVASVVGTSALGSAAAMKQNVTTSISSSHHSRRSSNSTSSATSPGAGAAAVVADATVLGTRCRDEVGSKHVTTSIHAGGVSGIAGMPGSAAGSYGRSKSAVVRAPGSQLQQQQLQHSTSLPARRRSSRSNSETAMALAQQVANAQPGQPDLSLQGQMASLMSAIAAGVEERKALAAQGQMLLEMVTGSSCSQL